MQDQRPPTVAEEIEENFATNMRYARRQQRISQTALAKELESYYGVKVDGTAITRMEKNSAGVGTAVRNDARAIRLGEAAAIAGVLGLTLDEMTGIGQSVEDRLAELRKRQAAAKVKLDTASRELAMIDKKISELGAES